MVGRKTVLGIGRVVVNEQRTYIIIPLVFYFVKSRAFFLKFSPVFIPKHCAGYPPPSYL